MRNFDIDIFRLSNSVHQFNFEIDQAFFESIDQELVEKGKIDVRVDLEKNDRFIAMDFDLQGTVELVCDRSLDMFDYKIARQQKLIFKYGDQERELSEDMMMITLQTQKIDVGQLIFEFIGLALPMKKLHPRYEDLVEDGSYRDQIIYTSQEDLPDRDSGAIDPRWDELKQLKKD